MNSKKNWIWWTKALFPVFYSICMQAYGFMGLIGKAKPEVVEGFTLIVVAIIYLEVKSTQIFVNRKKSE